MPMREETRVYQNERRRRLRDESARCQREPFFLERASVAEVAAAIEAVRREADHDRRLARWLAREERRAS